jgi:hypothetical protein|tara:strand:+ start:526 stop:942 length:417 start_codon:yes stop_codon:yes gene_type:complete
MADGYALATQVGIRSALSANSGVTDIVGVRIYDEPPQPVTFPYIKFGDVIPEAFDTDNTEGAEVTIALEAHSQSASGRVEAVQMVEAIKDALHRKETLITIAGFNLVELIFERFYVTRNTEGRGYDAVILLQATIETP